MTLDHAAEAAAIQDERDHREPTDLPWIRCPFATRDLYVRAFRQGAQWQQQQEFTDVCQSVETMGRNAVIAYLEQQKKDLMPYVRHLPTCRYRPASSGEGMGGRHEDWPGVSCDCGLTNLLSRVAPLTNSPSPTTGTTAQADKGPA